MDELSKFLLQETPIERIQKKNHKFMMDIPAMYVEHQHKNLILNQSFFFRNREIFVSKHNRYAEYPEHSHSFLELNYVYSGRCNQRINNKDVTLNTGDILLLDVGTHHSIYELGPDDILINILFRTQDIHADVLDKIRAPEENQNSLFNFFMGAMIQDVSHDQYMIFRKTKTSGFQQVINNIIQEYYFPHDYSDEIIGHYLSILFFNLARDYKAYIYNNSVNLKPNDLLSKVINEIEQGYKGISLCTTAEKLNYNKNYLSNFVKEKTGQTFTQLVCIKRITKAHELIKTTDLTISRVVEAVGFSSKNYFYSEYKKMYGHLPSIDKKLQMQ